MLAELVAQGDIFRRVFLWSLVFLAFICALSGLGLRAVLDGALIS